MNSWQDFNRGLDQMLARDPAAVDQFKHYIDSYGWNDRLSPYAVIYGHLAARQTGKEKDAAQLLADAQGKFTDAWPAPVLTFLRREIDDKALLAQARTSGEQTEAHCYLALDFALKKRKDEAITHFRWVTDHGDVGFVEFRVALAELTQLEMAPDAGVDVNGATRVLGGAFDPAFTDTAPDGAMLVGFEIGLGKFGNSDTVGAARPIYRTGAKETPGNQHGTKTKRLVKVVAREGYAVGAITVKAALVVDGMSITFMKIDNGQLDPNDAYESAWIGGNGGGPPVRLGGTGTPAIGIAGKANNRDMTGLGLLLQKR
jgi:hypothetical protein